MLSSVNQESEEEQENLIGMFITKGKETNLEKIRIFYNECINRNIKVEKAKSSKFINHYFN